MEYGSIYFNSQYRKGIPFRNNLFTYLELPISDKKLRRDMLPWIEKIGDKLPSWKANLMNMAGRSVWVKFVLSALPVHVLIAINILKCD